MTRVGSLLDRSDAVPDCRASEIGGKISNKCSFREDSPKGWWTQRTGKAQRGAPLSPGGPWEANGPAGSLMDWTEGRVQACL